MVFFCQIHRMFSCFVTSSVEIYCHSYAITMILATADFLGGEQKQTRQKCMCLKGMTRVWYQNVCITNFSRLTLKFTNSFKVLTHAESKKVRENWGAFTYPASKCKTAMWEMFHTGTKAFPWISWYVVFTNWQKKLAV